MNRKFAVALAATAAVATAAGLAWAAQEKTDETVERRVIVRHAGGGSFLGVTLAEAEGKARGARVRSVEPDSAAAKAGVKDGDVIVRFDGEAVRSAVQLSRLVRETPAGREVAIEVERDGAPVKLTATLGEGGRRSMRWFGSPGEDFEFELPEAPEPPEPPEAPGAPGVAPRAPRAPRMPAVPALPRVPHAWRFEGDGDRLLHMFPGGPRKLGLEYIDLGDQLAAYFKTKGGVLVTSVDPEGPAAKAGIKAGDVILKFGERAVGDASDLREAVADAEGGTEVALSVQREGRPVDVKVTLASPQRPKHRRAGGVSL